MLVHQGVGGNSVHQPPAADAAGTQRTSRTLDGHRFTLCSRHFCVWHRRELPAFLGQRVVQGLCTLHLMLLVVCVVGGGAALFLRWRRSSQNCRARTKATGERCGGNRPWPWVNRGRRLVDRVQAWQKFRPGEARLSKNGVVLPYREMWKQWCGAEWQEERAAQGDGPPNKARGLWCCRHQDSQKRVAEARHRLEQ